MKRSTILKILALVDTAVGARLAYRLLLIPHLRKWGATADEVVRSMPGDEIVPNPTFTGTRAVTIMARPQDIWPWLVQIGYGRAGFYSYEMVDRLMGLPIDNSDRVLAQLQELKAGDTIPMGPGKDASLPVINVQPHSCLAMGKNIGGGGVTWAFGLYSVNDQQTRLISRNRALLPGWTIRAMLRHPSRLRIELPIKLFFELGSFLMVRKMLLGVKARAEQLAAYREVGEALAESVG